ncbi:O-methyltransferase-domain-containing protein [Coprinopsis sp. MPI-PUGE-AT-0042]|nr:O-methyltransferase-domain-containing protein [Coprinopsis sp. MPI-PUGE-AT-0042]
MAAKDGALSALVALIADATKIVEAHYKATSEPYVPSLDDTEPHPLDSQIYPAELRQAVQTIEAACSQLSATVSKPSRAVVNREMEAFGPHCINVAISLKIADALNDKPEGMHIDELASVLDVNANKLGRILRLLVSRHIFREASDDVFANNRLSMKLLSDSPIASLGGHFTEEAGKSAGELTSILRDPEWGHSFSPLNTALNRHYKFDGTFFQYLEEANVAERFGKGMVAWGDACEAESIVTEFPWTELPAGTTFCDVGGGIGNMAMHIAKAHPHIQVKLQDQPKQIEQAIKDHWPKHYPQAIEENRIEFKSIDFFTEAPISGCDIYYLKHIIHDWPDAQCQQILKNVRRAMAPQSRLLIHEFIIQHANRVHAKSLPQRQAPEPLMANWGTARIRSYNLDILMMTILNARERTLEDFVNLAQQADLRFVKVWDFDELAMIEFRAGPGDASDI